MSRTTITFTISVSPEMADELERVREIEQLSRSELVQKALRRYFRDRLWQQVRRSGDAI